MGVSFTISNKGKIYRPQPKPEDQVEEEEVDTKEQDQDSNAGNAPNNQVDPAMYNSSASVKSTLKQLEALEPSFSLNLFTNGFTFDNTNEFFHDEPENLYPYNSDTKSVLKDIEYGRLPTGLLLDSTLCQYVNGTVLCEVRDYCFATPSIKKVALKMSLDNFIDDIYSMSGKLSVDDQLKFESKVLLSLHPHLNLDPTPTLDFCKAVIPLIDLGIDYGKKTRNMDDGSKKNIVGNEITESDFFENESGGPVLSVIEDNWITSDK